MFISFQIHLHMVKVLDETKASALGALVPCTANCYSVMAPEKTGGV
jgi:hypothetical protein